MNNSTQRSWEIKNSLSKVAYEYDLKTDAQKAYSIICRLRILKSDISYSQLSKKTLDNIRKSLLELVMITRTRKHAK